MGTNNMAAMRGALVQCELFLGNVSRHGHPTLNPGDKCTACDGVDELREMVVRALSAPPRNCDVGDAADWEKRFGEECDKGHICSDCPVKRAKTRMAIEHDKGARCEFVWAQMLYEEGGAK